MQAEPFATEFDETRATLMVAGEVDEAAAATLRELIETHSVGFTRPLVLDLSEVLYLPSAAVGVLARATGRATAAGGELELLATEGTIAERVLKVCALPHRTS